MLRRCRRLFSGMENSLRYRWIRDAESAKDRKGRRGFLVRCLSIAVRAVPRSVRDWSSPGGQRPTWRSHCSRDKIMVQVSEIIFLRKIISDTGCTNTVGARTAGESSPGRSNRGRSQLDSDPCNSKKKADRSRPFLILRDRLSRDRRRSGRGSRRHRRRH